MIKKIIKKIYNYILAYLRGHPLLLSRMRSFIKTIGIEGILRKAYLRAQNSTEDESLKLRRYVTSSYSTWSACFDTPSDESINQMEVSKHTHSKAFIIVYFDQNSEKRAGKLIEGLRNSVGQEWYALFLFEKKSKEIVQSVEALTKNDSRILFEDSPALRKNSEFIFFIEGGASPRPHALRIFSDFLRSNPQALLAYSDEDQINSTGVVSDPWFKPQFSPLLLSQGLLLGRMIGLRQSDLVEQLILAKENPAALIRKFALLAGEKKIAHIPHILFHNLAPSQKQLPLELSLPTSLPVVSIVIPTKDRWDLLGPCLDSLKQTHWTQGNMEIVIVDNGSKDPLTLKMLKEAKEANLIKLIRDEGEFNWSRLNNVGVEHSRGQLFVFLNNDTEIIDPEWLKKIALHALSPNSGAVGCKLLYPDKTVQHGGVIAGIQGVVAHAHLFLGANKGGYHNLANTTHEVVAVTGACLAVTRDSYSAVGGFNESFPIAFSDIVFCFDLHLLGKRNIYVADCSVVHHESKSRGYNNTPEKIAQENAAARAAWSLYPSLFHNDPFYSQNLSLAETYELSSAPRRKPLWSDLEQRRPRVMMLSVTHAIGHGVAVVVALQAEALLKHGYEVIMAGPRSANDFPYPGCLRIEVSDAQSAATLAVIHSVDVIIAHTPPFFSVARWTGDYPPVISYDYGEPTPDWFPDAEGRRTLLAEKDQVLMMASKVFAISEAIKAESRTPVHGVLPLGNSHLGQWDEAAMKRRQRVRLERGWDDKIVVLNVCRFHKGERLYKGIDIYAEVRDVLQGVDSQFAKQVIFVLCGKGSPEDVDHMTKRGLVVAANVTDDEMADLYSAADAYANFSQWEGYNLGIGQALAMGLPTIASDIPAHQAFGIKVTNNTEAAAKWLIEISKEQKTRKAHIWSWDNSLSQLIEKVDDVSGYQQ